MASNAWFISLYIQRIRPRQNYRQISNVHNFWDLFWLVNRFERMKVYLCTAMENGEQSEKITIFYMYVCRNGCESERVTRPALYHVERKSFIKIAATNKTKSENICSTTLKILRFSSFSPLPTSV